MNKIATFSIRRHGSIQNLLEKYSNWEFFQPRVAEISNFAGLTSNKGH